MHFSRCADNNVHIFLEIFFSIVKSPPRRMEERSSKTAFHVIAEFYSNSHSITEQALCRLGNWTTKRSFDVGECEISSFQLIQDDNHKIVVRRRPSWDTALRDLQHNFEVKFSEKDYRIYENRWISKNSWPQDVLVCTRRFYYNTCI